MPLLATRGAASAKGFGFGSRILTTYVFPAGTSTWTAPANLTSLVSATGKGSNGTSDYGYIAGGGSVSIEPGVPSGPQPAYLKWENIAIDGQGFISSINAAGSGPVTLTTWVIQQNVYPDDTWNSLPNGYVSGGRSYYQLAILTDIVWVRGSASYFLTGSGATSGNATYAAGNGAFAVQATIQGYAGDATTGFGKTFPGGTYTNPTGNPAPTTTFTDVAITPGTTYTIVNNQSLVIQYYI